MSEPDPERVRIVGMRLFQRIADRWSLEDAQRAALLGISGDEYASVCAEPSATVTPSMLDRISHVLAIYTALHSLLPDPQCDGWIHRANTGPGFGGRPALVRIMSADIGELRAVREYLDAQLYR